MKIYQPSDTYKFFFNNIIGELLSKICDSNPNYCLRTRWIPYDIGSKFEEYRENANKNMSNPRLDRHKLASCICGAIMEIQPIGDLTDGKVFQKVNEIVALHVGLNVIKYYMMYDLTCNLSYPQDIQNQIKAYLRENFDMGFPGLEDNICDAQEYETNLLNALHWTHHECDLIGRECYQYDIWAYAKIFYHLEVYNQPKIEEAYKGYVENLLEQVI